MLNMNLTNIPLFESLPEKTLAQIIQAAIPMSYTNQQIIVHQGDIWPYFFLVSKGEIHAVKESAEGRVLIATTLREGEFFWGLGFFVEDAEMPVMLQAGMDSELYLWPRQVLVPLIASDAALAWRLCQMMITRMQMASEIVDELAFQPVGSRVARLLLEEFGDVDDFKPRDLTLRDMAAHTGTTQEMVCRHLYRLAKEGAIEIRRTQLRVVQRELLEKYAACG